MTREGEVYRTIATNIRLERAKQNITLNELAKRSGISPTTLSFLENGKKNYRMGTVAKIADALGVGVDDLTKGV